MGSLELRTVLACVDAITSSYREGVKLLHKIQAKRKPTGKVQSGPGAAHELEVSLHQGDANVRSQFDRNLKRFGNAFARGDRMSAF